MGVVVPGPAGGAPGLRRETAGFRSLVGNTEALIDELAAMGLARRYPDAVAFVGDGSL